MNDIFMLTELYKNSFPSKLFFCFVLFFFFDRYKMLKQMKHWLNLHFLKNIITTVTL